MVTKKAKVLLQWEEQIGDTSYFYQYTKKDRKGIFLCREMENTRISCEEIIAFDAFVGEKGLNFVKSIAYSATSPRMVKELYEENMYE